MCLFSDSKKEMLNELQKYVEFGGIGEGFDKNGRKCIIVLSDCQGPKCEFELKIPSVRNGIPVIVRRKEAAFL